MSANLAVATKSDSIQFSSIGATSVSAGDVIYKIEPRKPDRFTEYELYDVDDWDGYGARPISQVTVDSARRFYWQIPRRFAYVDVAPGADGTVGFEWRFGTARTRSFIFIDIGPGDVVTAREVNPGGKITQYPPTRVGPGAENLIAQLF
jgi:hypothetical protein